jgi:hypothetical protein
MKLKNYALFLCFLFFPFVKSNTIDDSTNFEDRMDEINRNLKHLQKEQKKLANKISEMKSRDKQRVLASRDVKFKKFTKKHNEIYPLPSWPFNSLFFYYDNLFQIGLTYDFATKSFGASGGSQDILDQIFANNDIKIQDILLVSKLVREGKLTATATSGYPDYTSGSQYHYYYLLADQELDFDGSSENLELDLNLSHHFYDGKICLGAEFPIVRRKNRIKMNSQIPLSLRDTMYAYTPQFYSVYQSLDDFLEEILAAKGIEYNKKDTSIGFGDIKLFGYCDIFSTFLQKWLVGFKLTLPSSFDSQDTADKLWQPNRGNGGFVEFSLYTSLLKQIYSGLNPHLRFEATVGLPANVYRRIPQRKIYEGGKDGEDVGNFLVLASGSTQFTDQTFDEPDSTVPHFADESKRVKINRGPQFNFRIGNIIEEVFWRKGFLDIFYDFWAKGRDYLCSSDLSSAFDTSGLNDQTYQMAHRIGLNFSYQFSGRKRFNIGIMNTFYGYNTPKELMINAAFNLEF